VKYCDDRLHRECCLEAVTTGNAFMAGIFRFSICIARYKVMKNIKNFVVPRIDICDTCQIGTLFLPALRVRYA
jgi:hypothetical protein